MFVLVLPLLQRMLLLSSVKVLLLPLVIAEAVIGAGTISPCGCDADDDDPDAAKVVVMIATIRMHVMLPKDDE